MHGEGTSATLRIHRDLHHDLRNLRDHASDMSAAAPVPQAKKPYPKWPVAVAAIVMAAAAGYSFSRFTIPDATDISHHQFTSIATETTGSAPMWSPDGKSILYASVVKGMSQLFVRSLDSAMPAQITRGGKWCRDPFWHPKEPRVFFLSGNDLYSVAIAGGEPELVLTGVNTASISPDGKAVVVMRREPNKLQAGFVEISSPPGAPTRKYVPEPFAGGTYFGGTLLRFAPDGNQIFFAVRHPKGPQELWLLPWPNEGGRETPKRIMTSVTGLIGSFSWWPDSLRAIVSISGVFGPEHLWLADTRRGLVHAITAGLAGENGADLSPDGNRIAYSAVEQDYDVMDVPINDDPLRKVVATSRSEASAVWSPKATQLAYLTNRSGTYEIWLKSTQEGWERPVVKRTDFSDGVDGILNSLAFSPDGTRIAYTRSLLDTNYLWISSLSGGPASRLTADDGTGQFAPTWSPDGNWIAFLQISGPSLKLVKARGGGREAPIPIDSQLGDMGVSNPRWSPKGDWLTATTRKGTVLVSPDGKTSRTLNGQFYQRMAWSADGSLLYAMRVFNSETLLSSIDFATGKEKLIRKIGNDTYFQDPIDLGQTFSLNPDGKSFLMTVKHTKSDVWMLEGFHHP